LLLRKRRIRLSPRLPAQKEQKRDAQVGEGGFHDGESSKIPEDQYI
jgi:hypothetical protein